MRRMTIAALSKISIGVAMTALAGCGLRQPLEPPPGRSAPVAPATAPAETSVEESLIPPPIARPERVDELLRRSEERQEDRFDLSPADVPSGDDPLAPERSPQSE